MEPIDELPPDEDGRDVTGAFASLTRVFAQLQGDVMGRPSRYGAGLDSRKVATAQSALCQDRHSHVLSEVQRVDLFVTQQWIRLLIWEYTMRHFKMSRESSDQAFSLLLPMAIARELLSLLCSVRMESICAHGYGMVSWRSITIVGSELDKLTCGRNSRYIAPRIPSLTCSLVRRQ